MKASDPDYFLKKAMKRFDILRSIKSKIDVKNDSVKGRDRDIIVKRKIVFKSLEQKFKDHAETFKVLHTDTNHETQNKQNDNFAKFDELLHQAGEVCDTIIPNIKYIKQQDRKINQKFQFIKKNFETSLDVNVENWNKDKNYQIVKEQLIQMQQEDKLPDYCKFCMINSRDTMRRMQRSTQEVKETRLLYSLSPRIHEKQLQSYMENTLRKFQRMKQNQELKRDGLGWKLVSKKENRIINEDELLKQNHLTEKPPITLKQEIKQATSRFKEQLREENRRITYQNSQSQPILKRYKQKIFRTENSPSKTQEQFELHLKDTVFFQQIHNSKIVEVKNNINRSLQWIQQRQSKPPYLEISPF